MAAMEEELKVKWCCSTQNNNDDDDAFDDDEEEDDEGAGGEHEIAVSYACEDCDYRWEIYVEEEDEMDDTQYCPMCGSANTSQI